MDHFKLNCLLETYSGSIKDRMFKIDRLSSKSVRTQDDLMQIEILEREIKTLEKTQQILFGELKGTM